MNTDQRTRRSVLKASVALPAAQLLGQNAKSTVYAYVGCFTTPERHGRGDGIHVYRMDPETGGWAHVERVGNLVNPSFLITSRDQRFLYSAHADEEYASAFSVDPKSGSLKQMNEARTGGRNGAHLALSPNGKFVIMANYASGTVAVLPVRPDGALANYIQLAELKGEPGPHRVEQTSSHPHEIVFDPSGRYIAVPDKGLDRIFLFNFDAQNGKITPTSQGSIVARSGSGPRHIAFHPRLPVAWVINELASSVTTYRWDSAKGALYPIQILPSIPADYIGANTGSEILTTSSGRFVYCSNRGHDSVGAFSVNGSTGLLTSIGWTPTKGKDPRYIGLDPSQRFLYTANEQGDTIVTYRVNAATGRLTATGQIVRNDTPVTIAYAAAGKNAI